MCYTIIPINFITHPVAYWLFNLATSTPQNVYVSAYFYVIALLILEALVIAIETVLISWSMRYTMFRSFIIACLIQVITLVLSIISLICYQNSVWYDRFFNSILYSCIFISLVCFSGGLLKLRAYKLNANKNSLIVAFIFFIIGLALLYLPMLTTVGSSSLGNGKVT